MNKELNGTIMGNISPENLALKLPEILNNLN